MFALLPLLLLLGRSKQRKINGLKLEGMGERLEVAGRKVSLFCSIIQMMFDVVAEDNFSLLLLLMLFSVFNIRTTMRLISNFMFMNFPLLSLLLFSGGECELAPTSSSSTFALFSRLLSVSTPPEWELYGYEFYHLNNKWRIMIPLNDRVRV